MSAAPDVRLAALEPLGLPSPADLAILRTVIYASLFQAPQTLAELQHGLLDLPLTRAALAARLRGPYLRERLRLTEGLVHLRGREEWVALRRARRRRSRELLVRHRRLLAALARFPFVRLLALSGACARENAADEDVDVFLVVKRGRAWAVALALMLLSKALGVRRTLCLNYIVDETQLALPERDLFTASEIVGLRPLAGGEAYRLFVEANRTLAARYPNFLARYAAACRGLAPAGAPGWLEALLELGPAPLLEAASRLLLGRRLRRKLAGARGVLLSASRLKLHSHDHRPRIGAAFATELRRFGLEAEGAQP
jgi:hypothetical protein